MEITAIRAHLEGLKDPHLAQFSSGLLPGLTPHIGRSHTAVANFC